MQVVPQAHRIAVLSAAEIDRVGLGLGDVLGEVAVVVGARVRAVVPTSVRAAVLLGGDTEELGAPVALGGAVPEQEHRLDAQAACPVRGGGGLNVVRGHDTRKRAVAGGVVLVRLAGLGARHQLGQPDRARSRAHLDEPGLVGDRQRHRRRARVEVADVGDRALVLDRLARVLGGAVGIPSRLAVAGGRIVRGGEVDGEVSRLPARVA